MGQLFHEKFYTERMFCRIDKAFIGQGKALAESREGCLCLQEFFSTTCKGYPGRDSLRLTQMIQAFYTTKRSEAFQKHEKIPVASTIIGFEVTAAINEPCIDKIGFNADIKSGKVMFGIVAHHDRFFRRQSKTVEKIAEIAGIGFAKTGIFDGRYQIEREIAHTAPGKAGINDGSRKNRIGGKYHGKVKGTTLIENLSRQWQGIDESLKTSQAVYAVIFKTSKKKISVDTEALLQYS